MLPLLALALAPQQLTLDAFPKDLQLYPRDAAGGASVAVSGSVLEPGCTSIELALTRAGVPWDQQSVPLQYSGGAAPFSFTARIDAELAEYGFTLTLNTASGPAQAAAAANVVAGDAILIQGQSNAVAGDAHQEYLGNTWRTEWVRSYSTASIWDFKVLNDSTWSVADGQNGNLHGTIGQWGLRMARQLVDSTQVPLAILNGAVGATPIKYHSRNDANPMDLGTNYGRLLYRAEQAGLRDAAFALFWYQGESDNNDFPHYGPRFDDLYHDWLSDFPGVQKVYVFQVHNGCGAPNEGLRELQRQFGDLYPLVDVLSTTDAPDHDGCHYYHDGYDELGDRAARLVARDFYAAPPLNDIEAPNIASASYTTPAHDEILLVFRDADDTLTWERGAQARFLLRGGVGAVRSGRVVGPGMIRLRLAGPSMATDISYDYPSGETSGIVNARGIGALTFYRLPIQ